MCVHQKEWTFLLYANGHNELEPEAWQSVVSIKNHPLSSQINAVVQISREEPNIIALLRPNLGKSAQEHWSGVRRYVFSTDENEMFVQSESVNMADPGSLYDFLMWAVARAPAKRYMLSIAGHIYQFVGLCPDYSGNLPYMMGFPEISACIQSACQALDIRLDALLLDTCYASTIEILYEFGRYEQPCIQTIFTYIGKGPLRGLPYDNVLSILGRVCTAPTEDVLRQLVAQTAVPTQCYGLIALRLDCETLQLIKQLFSNLVKYYQACAASYQVDFTPEELLCTYRSDYPWSHCLVPIHRLLDACVLAKRCASNAEGGVLPIHILYQKIPDEQRKRLYCRLAFSKQNHWAALLCDLPFENLPNEETENKPLVITKNILAAFIYSSDENLTPSQHKALVDELIKIKHWELYSSSEKH